MSEIDWSKAPEGATHYAPAIGRFRALWAKVEDGQFSFYDEVVDRWYWGAQPLRHETFIPRPVAWTGAGLPPVGTVCWVSRKSGQDSPYEGECTIVAHHMNGKNPVAVYVRGEPKGMYASIAMESCFSPLRTQEQIEAEEREREIQEMCDLLKAHRNSINGAMCEKLHGFGYRKQGEDK